MSSPISATKPTSIRADEAESTMATFRDRLRSQSVLRETPQTPPTKPSRLLPDSEQEDDLSKPSAQFLEALASMEDPKDDEVTRRLKRASANACIETHNMAVKELRQTHDDIDKAIDQLSEPTNLLLSQNIALHTNIEHPLSATLCHSTSTPRATVTRHCSNLQSALQAKKKALDDLVVRWTQCFKDEEAILDRLDAAGKAQSDAASESSKAQDIDALEREVKSIVTETEEAIDEIETHFCDAIKAETVRMISNMM